MLDNVELIMYVKFQKLLMTGCRDIDKKDQKCPRNGFFPHLPPPRYFFKNLALSLLYPHSDPTSCKTCVPEHMLFLASSWRSSTCQRSNIFSSVAEMEIFGNKILKLTFQRMVTTLMAICRGLLINFTYFLWNTSKAMSKKHCHTYGDVDKVEVVTASHNLTAKLS